MLNFTLTDNYAEMSTLAAKRVRAGVERKPDLVMALPTGGTPIGLLQRDEPHGSRQRSEFFAGVFVHIDEYIR